MRLIVAFLAVVFSAQSCLAWSEGGHHLIAVMAFDSMQQEHQRAILELLKSHPRFAEDFKIPPKAEQDPEHWLIGRAGYWPDVARRSPYDRPNWHWQLGPSLVIGNPANVPKNPGPCPTDATLDTKDLHVAQAIELCRRVLKDDSQPAADRALAVCWLAHLVADSHQPCHAGSLYSEKLFPQGDRGANSIKTTQRGNMHALWDGLLGPSWDAGDIRRRQKELEHVNQTEFGSIMMARPDALIPATWLAESVQFAKDDVYDSEVLDAITAAEKTGAELKPITLSEDHLKRAGKVAQFRAIYASQRLAKILVDDISE